MTSPIPNIEYKYEYETDCKISNNDYNALCYLQNDPYRSYLVDEYCEMYHKIHGCDLQDTFLNLVGTITGDHKLTTKTDDPLTAQTTYDEMKNKIPIVYLADSTIKLQLYRSPVVTDRNSGISYYLHTNDGNREIIREDVFCNAAGDKKVDTDLTDATV